MGAAKASLEWHRVDPPAPCRRPPAADARRAGRRRRRPGQTLPALPARCELVVDGRPDRGPLEALAAGLGALAGRADVAFVTATDAPLLHPAFVAAVLAALDADHDVCLPVLDGRSHPLSAAYRVGAAAAAAADLLAADRLRLGLLLDRCRVRRLDAADLLAWAPLARADPRLESVVNLNDIADYAAARARPAPSIHLAGGPGTPLTAARAATLAAAALAAGVVLGAGDELAAEVNGWPAAADPELPLVAGDVVTFARRTTQA